MQDNDSFIRSLLIDVRRHQNDTELLSRTITEKQITAFMTRLSKAGLKMPREQRLDCTSRILGYKKCINSTLDLSMADGMGLLDLSDEEFTALFVWAQMQEEDSALV